MATKRLRITVLVGFAALCLRAASAASVPYEPKTELGFLFGGALSDRDLNGHPDNNGSVGPAAGVRFAHLLGSSANWFADATASWHGDNDRGPGQIEVVNFRTGFELFTGRPVGRARWFVSGAGGWSFVDYDTAALDFDRPMVSAGLGQRWLTDHLGFWRWEARVDRLLQNEGLNGADVVNAQLLLGWALPIGGPPPDADADGVPDRDDRCPGTPRGARVDATGCPINSDGDGVFDGLDRCPDTPRGVRVDPNGCPMDSDGDGVFDGVNRCPDTPRGATVDPAGCPKDTDADSVLDGLDRCPDTPRGAIVNRAGCPLDSDADGVFDGLDRCPETPRGVKVDANGCPVEPPPKVVESPFIPAPKQPVVLQGVNFATDSAKLTPESKEILDRVAAGLKDHPDVRVEVAGHTDSTGTDRHNQVLSQYRAESVRTYLIEQGVPAGRIEARGYGETEPINDNAALAGRAKNRRVELRRL